MAGGWAGLRKRGRGGRESGREGKGGPQVTVDSVEPGPLRAIATPLPLSVVAKYRC